MLNNAPAACAYCRQPLPGRAGPRVGRPAKYCDTTCRQAAHRTRKRPADNPQPPPDTSPTDPDTTPATPPCREPRDARPAGATPLPTEHDDALVEITRDMQDQLRQIARRLTGIEEDPQALLLHAIQLRAQLEGLTAGLVGHARQRRLTWARIASVLNIGEDTARHRYTDDYIARRLRQFAHPRTPEPSSQAPTARITTPGQPREVPTQTAAPPSPAGDTAPAAYNRLAPVLSMLARTSQLPLQALAQRSRCSASYLSRILSGERVPTWATTERFAQACGADAAVLRNVWETERLREKTPNTAPLPPASADDTPDQARHKLHTAVRTLHVRAGQPTAYEIAVALKWDLNPDHISAMLEGDNLPDWEDLTRMLHILGGSPTYFRTLWKTASQPTPQPSKPAPASTPAPGIEDSPPAEGVHEILEQFSPILASPPPLTPQQRHSILRAKRDAVRARLAQRGIQSF